MRFLLAALALGMALPAAAETCPPTRTGFVFVPELPADAEIPSELLVVKVRVISTSAWAEVEILEPVDGLRGVARIHVNPGAWEDCSSWGATRGPAYMIGVLERRPGEEIVFRAIQFRATETLRQFRKRHEHDQIWIDPDFAPLTREPSGTAP